MNHLAYAAVVMSALISASASAAPTAAAVESKKSAVSSTPVLTPTIKCPGDTAVWVNARSKAYHVQGDKLFGHTKHGKFECRKAADGEGDHLAKAR